MKIIKLSLLLSICLAFSSCEALLLIAEIAANRSSSSSQLDLNDNWRCNLLGSVIVEGTINNRGSKSYCSVTMEAKIYDKQGYLIKTERFTERGTLSGNSSICFKENLGLDRKKVGSVKTRIVSSY